MKEKNIKAILANAANCLKSDEAALETQLLFQHTFNVNRAWLIAHENDALTPAQITAFESLIQRRIAGEPIAYILGYREFYSLKLKTTPDTLIPRPDTETLVETALEKIPLDAASSVADLGTGTGAIALAIAKHRSQTQVKAVDTSQAALNVAIENAENLGIRNVRFLLSDWFTTLNNEKFDVIVSNPPYIEANDAHLQQGDLRFEPITALASGDDGLDDIRTIITGSTSHLKSQGYLLLEHGYDQAKQVQKLMVEAGLVEISTVKDLGGNDRVTLGKLP